MRVAAVDIGSNTTLLLIAEVKNGRLERVVCDKTEVTKLGQGVHQARKFHPDALKRVRECLGRYREMIDANNVDAVAAVATSAARDVTNKQDLFEICEAARIPLEIITGDREARMTFLGALSGETISDGVSVIDVGGGSTELMIQDHGELKAVSVDVGSVRLNDLFVSGHPIAPKELNQAAAYAEKLFSEGRQKLGSAVARKVVGVAGTPTTLAALEWDEPFSETKVHGFKLTQTMVEKWIDTMAPLTIAEREKFRGLQPQRADVIVMGSVALRAAMRALSCSELTVSVRGLRYGLALEMSK